QVVSCAGRRAQFQEARIFRCRDQEADKLLNSNNTPPCNAPGSLQSRAIFFPRSGKTLAIKEKGAFSYSHPSLPRSFAMTAFY
ncbi:MAG: hypothetical protein NDI77_06225, partial [Geobacteraceae bacterium]|nr:hypothetical protein [Geobacteraceae bacterium]